MEYRWTKKMLAQTDDAVMLGILNERCADLDALATLKRSIVGTLIRRVDKPEAF